MREEALDISVVIPIYNAEEYVGRCLRSVRKALGALRYEVLLLDDESSDKSGTIAEEFAATHDGFFYTRLAHGGQGVARNIGIDRARGKYIQFTDADDMLVPGILEDMFYAAEQTGSEIVMQNLAGIQDEKVRASTLALRCFSKLSPEQRTANIKQCPQLIYGVLMTDKIFLRSFLVDHNIRFSEGVMFEDIYPGLQAGCLANSITILRTRGYYYRTHEKQTTKDANASFFLNRMNELKRMFAFLDEQVQDDAVRKEFELKIVIGDFWLPIDRPEEFGDDLEDVLHAIADILRTYISPETFDRLPVVHKQIMQAVLDDDTNRFIELAHYRKEKHGKVPIVKRDNAYYMQLPEEYFPQRECNAKNDFYYAVPLSQVRTLEAARDTISITGHLFQHRIDLTSEDDMHVRAWMINERTGTFKEGQIERIQSEYLTKQRYNEDDETHYNYDWAGFSLTFNTEEVLCDSNMIGKNLIVMGYESPVLNGYRVLRGIVSAVRKKLPNTHILLDEYHITMDAEPDSTLAIWVHEWNEGASQKGLMHNLLEQNTMWEDMVQTQAETLAATQEELNSMREEVASVREELTLMREKLDTTKKELKETRDQLASSQDNLKIAKDELVAAKESRAKTQAKLEKTQDRLEETRKSWNYRVGQKVTWLPKRVYYAARKRKQK